MSETEKLLQRLDALLDRIEPFIPSLAEDIREFDGGAYYWQTYGQKSLFQKGLFHKINRPINIKLSDLKCIERQKEHLTRNTEQFLANLPANNVLLWGPKGTGKSSLIKALTNEYQADGLNLIEIERNDISNLRNIIEPLSTNKGHFILYCDDLSFEADDPDYKTIKIILDGSLSNTPDNILIYATSNRRHLVPESMQDNINSQTIQGELHLNETIEERISLSERFGVWLAFHPFNQQQYLEIVDYWLSKFGFITEDITIVHKAALKWALEHGSRSGRSASQFVKDWVGQHKIKGKK